MSLCKRKTKMALAAMLAVALCLAAGGCSKAEAGAPEGAEETPIPPAPIAVGGLAVSVSDNGAGADLSVSWSAPTGADGGDWSYSVEVYEAALPVVSSGGGGGADAALKLGAALAAEVADGTETAFEGLPYGMALLVYVTPCQRGEAGGKPTIPENAAAAKALCETPPPPAEEVPEVPTEEQAEESAPTTEGTKTPGGGAQAGAGGQAQNGGGAGKAPEVVWTEPPYSLVMPDGNVAKGFEPLYIICQCGAAFPDAGSWFSHRDGHNAFSTICDECGFMGNAPEINAHSESSGHFNISMNPEFHRHDGWRSSNY